MTRPQFLKSNKGFTVIEVMVALVIMMVGMVGLLQALGMAMEQNLRNQMREGAISLGEKTMNDLRTTPFANITGSYPAATVASALRAGTSSYTVERTAPVLSADATGPTSRELRVVVKWTYKGVEYRNRVVSPISRPIQ